LSGDLLTESRGRTSNDNSLAGHVTVLGLCDVQVLHLQNLVSPPYH
jgi:hypothetical protein